MDYKRLAKKYQIRQYTDNGKKITYNKLKHKVIDYENKKHKLSETQKLHNCIVQYLSDNINENELNNAMYNYMGKYI